MSDPNPLETLVDRAFAEFGGALKGSGIDAARDWNKVLIAKATLSSAAEQVAGAIQTAQTDPMLNDMQRAETIRQANAIFDSVHQSATKELQQSLANIEATLHEATLSDLAPADPQERVLIRQEIDMLLSEATKGRGGSDGEPFRSGQSTLAALMALAQSNPGRYGAEIAGDYGRIKLQTSGEGQFTKDLTNNIIKITPGTTPKAISARAALAAMVRTKVAGMPAGLSHLARERVAAANRPLAPERGMFRPDTIRPIR